MAFTASNSFVVKNVLLFTGHEFIQDGFVVVQDGKVTALGTGDPPNYDGIPTISKPGDTLLPGFIDSHIHALSGNTESIEQSLRFGVTTVCDMHNDHEHIAKLTKLARDPANRGRYADLKSCGLGATIEGGWPAPVIRREFEHTRQLEVAEKLLAGWPMLGSPSDAAPFVADQVGKCEASYIKLFHELGDTLSMDLQRPPLDVQRAVVEAAHDHGLIAVGHALSHAGVLDLLSVGVDGLAHIFLDKPPNDDWIRIMKERNVHCNPTLSVCASLTGEGLELQRRFVQDPLAKRMLFNDEPRGDIGLASQCKHASIGHAYENAAALYYAGVPLIVGSDSAGRELGSAYGMGLHMEMYRMVHGVGMKPEDVLRGGTSLIAERFGFEDRGRIQEGARADLVLVNGDVRKCLSDEDSLCLPIKRVWRQGIMADVYQN